MRIHALALNRWFNNTFSVAKGYPIPFIYATPMDAFSKFDNLWRLQNNPFKYLEKVDSPHVDPTNPKFPLINCSLRSLRLRATQNYGSRTFRRISWPTVDAKVTKRDLASVTQARYPQAWDISYQIDFWCMRPDTQAIMIEQLMERFKLGGGEPQVWVTVVYPSYVGWMRVRVKLDGDIQDTTEKNPGEASMKYRTTFNLTVEGWKPDLDIVVAPTLWRVVATQDAIAPSDVNTLYQTYYVATQDGLDILDSNDQRISISDSAQYQVVTSTGIGTDPRTYADNPVINSRPNLPPDA